MGTISSGLDWEMVGEIGRMKQLFERFQCEFLFDEICLRRVLLLLIVQWECLLKVFCETFGWASCSGKASHLGMCGNVW
jgi:hypothetical protein